MTAEALAELEECEKRFARLTKELRSREPGGDRRVADGRVDAREPRVPRRALPRRRRAVRRVGREGRAAHLLRARPSGRRSTTSSTRLYERNQAEHRAIRQALAAGSVAGARELAHEHVMHSFELLTTILEHVAQPTGRAGEPRSRRIVRCADAPPALGWPLDERMRR